MHNRIKKKTKVMILTTVIPFLFFILLISAVLGGVGDTIEEYETEMNKQPIQIINANTGNEETYIMFMYEEYQGDVKFDIFARKPMQINKIKFTLETAEDITVKVDYYDELNNCIPINQAVCRSGVNEINASISFLLETEEDISLLSKRHIALSFTTKSKFLIKEFGVDVDMVEDVEEEV